MAEYGSLNTAATYHTVIPPKCCIFISSSSVAAPPLHTQVFVHGDELENYYKEFDAEILPAEFDGKAPKYDGKATAAKLFD